MEEVVKENDLHSAVRTLNSLVFATHTDFHKPSKATGKNLVPPKQRTTWHCS